MDHGQRTLDLLEALASASRVLGRHRLARTIPGVVTELARSALPEANVAVWMRMHRGAALRRAIEMEPDIADIRIELGEGRIGRAALESRTIAADEVSAAPYDSDCELAIPIAYDGGDALGVLAVAGLPTDVPKLGALNYLEGIAALAGSALVTASVVDTFRAKSVTDGLTQLVTKVHFLGELERALSSARASGRVVSVFMFDVDHFKHYNDRNGHPAGDRVLSQLGALLSGHFRQGVDLAGRYGGEEFVVMFPETPGDVAHGLAERFRSAVAETRFEHGEHQPLARITISGGVASSPRDGRTAAALIGCADRRLYVAKERGRDQVVSGLEGPARVERRVVELRTEEGSP